MNKTDTSIHSICISSIKRSTLKPYDFKWTKFYENKNEFTETYPNLLELTSEELPICSTIIDSENWSVLTTRKIVTKENGSLKISNFKNTTDKSYGNFKGYNQTEKTFGRIQLEDKSEMKYFIETGKASMVMVYGVRTRINMEPKTEEENEITIERLKKRGLLE